MKTLTKIAALALSVGLTGLANASSFTFSDSSSATISELDTSSFTSSIDYSALDNSITSAILTINLSDDRSSTFQNTVDLPLEIAQLTSVTGSLGSAGNSASPLASAEVDGNSGTINETILFMEINYSGDISSPTLGTISPYFNYDVTNLLGGTSGSLSFTLDALDTISNFPLLLGGGLYIEDFNYESAVLSIETSPVPVPATIWLMGSSLLGLFGYSRKRVVNITT